MEMGQRGIGCAVLINRVDPGHALQVLQCAGSMAGGIMIVLKKFRQFVVNNRYKYLD
ncbi:hypothetical protein [Methanohalophilus euhalobius]|uniref:hypothetical protein n=1 Tax=Methanohalophilus euhalobius TaxID=51203 RepID=UPI001C6115BE|nr:hypothetical protein [Methanohalophilus euhalobius]